MELTGKAKEDFKEWIFNNLGNGNIRFPYNAFRSYPKSMQWGVYVDFFDSQKIFLEIFADNDTISKNVIFNYVISLEDEHLDTESFEDYLTRSEAQNEAIKKANKIYNEKHFVFPHDLDKLNKE